MSTATHDESDILQVEGVFSKGFGFAPKLVMQDPRLSAVGKAIYCYFCSYAGTGRIAFPRVAKITYDLKISKDTFYTHFNPLKTFGYIKVEQTRLNGKHSHNIYTLLENVPLCSENGNNPFSPCPKISDTADTIETNYGNKSFSPCPKIPDTADAIDADYENKPFLPCPKIPDTVLPDTVIQDTNSNIFKNNRFKSNIFEKRPPNPPQARGGCAENENNTLASIGTADTINSKDSQNQSSENLKLKTGGGEDGQSSSQSMTLIDKRFEEFWSAYPRKVGKSAVYKVWKRLKPDADLFERILSAIENAKSTEQWHRESGRYIPNPLTWINQGRWDDVYSPTVPLGQHPEAKNSGNALTRLIERMEAEESARENEVWRDGS